MIDVTREKLENSRPDAAFGAFMPWNARQCLLFMFLCCCAAFAAHAQTPTPEMPPMPLEMELRLKKLETELRCLVCQNQTLADSPAGLAGDLRREIRLLADQNKSNAEIKEHLRARYGDFVLYSPPVDGKNYLLWFGPFVLLIGGAILLWVMNRRRTAQQLPDTPPDADALARGNALLKDE
jgi:cytochrome c-type biogenesis protein CcmH